MVIYKFFYTNKDSYTIVIRFDITISIKPFSPSRKKDCREKEVILIPLIKDKEVFIYIYLERRERESNPHIHYWKPP